MSTTIDLLPASVGDKSEWANFVAKPGCVRTNDGDTSYISANTYKEDLYNIDQLPANALSITNVDIIFIARRADSFTHRGVYPLWKVGVASISAAESDVTTLDYTQYTSSNVPTPTGVPWTVDAINSMQVGVGFGSNPGALVRVTQIIVRVTFETTPTGGAPNPPSGLSATPISSSQIDLAWTDNSADETGFNVYVCSSPGCAPSLLIASLKADVIAYSANNLLAASFYRYSVTAINANGESAPSNVAEANTPAAAAVPSPPPPPPVIRPSFPSLYLRLAGVDDKLYCSTFDLLRRFRIDEFKRIPNGAISPADGTRLINVGFDITASPPPLTFLDDGWSGDPLSMVPERPPLSGDSWMYIGDRLKMEKVRAWDCLALPIGLPIPPSIDQRFRIDEFAKAPDGSISARDRTRFTSVGFDIATGGPSSQTFLTLDSEKKTTINTFETAAWTNNTGTGAGAPSNATDADHKEGALSVAFTTNIGAGGGYNFWNKAMALDLSILDGGSLPASDNDFMHMWMKVDRPDLVREVRIYYVCSTAFDTATLPGTSTTLNMDAYVKAFTPDQFTPFIEGSNVAGGVIPGVGQDTQATQLLKKILDSRTGTTEIINAQRDPQGMVTNPVAPGRNQWTEFGIIGVPLYRGEFKRIGNDTTRDWKTVTGMVVLVWSSAGNIVLKLDDFFITGGRGLDSSQPGSTGYDYRVINYDPRTGDKSNGSVPLGPAYALDSLRRGINVHPVAFGDAFMHQRFYRRGGTLVSNWYYVGENGADGAAFLDIKADAEIVNAGILETDNDQPITTVDWEGTTILANPIPAIWGPISDMLFGCGDRYRPGHLYWSKPGQPSHWPGKNNAEVCSPTEELMNGCVWASQGYVFSRKRLFATYPNTSVPGVVNAVPTACSHGLAGRWALCVTSQGIAFCATDGVYITQGGPEVCITDQDLYPLFHGESKGDYKAVSFAYQNDIRMETHEDDLWLTYRDADGEYNHLIYSLSFKYWRPYHFDTPVAVAYSENQVGAPRQLVLGGAVNGVGYINRGLNDDGSPIAWKLRTGALDQGAPRPSKRYGDLTVEVDRGGEEIEVGGFINNEKTDLSDPSSGGGAPLFINSGDDRQRYILDLFGAAAGGLGPLLARNVSVELSGEVTQGRPKLYALGISYSVQQDTVVGRPTPWDSQGRLTDKYVKGIILECDTGGIAKRIAIEADTTFQTGITATSLGRNVLEFSFPQFRGRLLRIRPLDSVDWILHSMRWIFDEEPAQLDRWETQEIDHGLSESHMILWTQISLTSTEVVTLQISTYRENAALITHIYDIPSTNGQKEKVFVPCIANRGVFSKYLFTSPEKFWLYREESSVWVQPWAGGSPRQVHPFGNDDLDRVRGMGDAATIATRPGGGSQ